MQHSIHAEQVLLPWAMCRQIPVGVLYDLLASSLEEPWQLTVGKNFCVATLQMTPLHAGCISTCRVYERMPCCQEGPSDSVPPPWHAGALQGVPHSCAAALGGRAGAQGCLPQLSQGKGSSILKACSKVCKVGALNLSGAL